MIENNTEDIIKVLKKGILEVKELFYGLSFGVLILLNLIVFGIIPFAIGMVSALCLLLIVLIIFPKINSYNNDIQHLKRSELNNLEGDLLAIFKSDDTVGDEWKIFVNSGNQEYVTFEIGEKIAKKLTEGDVIKVIYTPNNKIIVSFKMVRKIITNEESSK